MMGKVRFGKVGLSDSGFTRPTFPKAVSDGRAGEEKELQTSC